MRVPRDATASARGAVGSRLQRPVRSRRARFRLESCAQLPQFCMSTEIVSSLYTQRPLHKTPPRIICLRGDIRAHVARTHSEIAPVTVQGNSWSRHAHFDAGALRGLVQHARHVG